MEDQPAGAVQYHDIDLDILNLDNAEKLSSVSTSSLSYNILNKQMDDGTLQNGYLTEDHPLENDFSPREYSKDGILDEDTIEIGLSNLGLTANGESYSYLHLKVAGYKLNDLTLLADYNQLQVVDLSYNRLENLSILTELPYLVELRAAHNCLTSPLDFIGENLRVADFTFNNISSIPEMSQHAHLQTLLLDNNQITKIQGLKNCCYLQNLSLSHNQISKIENLDDLSLKSLNLSYNLISIIENLQSLEALQHLSLSGNRIRNLRGLSGNKVLNTLELEENEILDIRELHHLKKLPVLHQLKLLRNPLQEIVEYRMLILFELPSLTELDNRKVDIEEKVSAENNLNPSLQVLAERDHRLNTVYQFFQPHAVHNSTLPNPDTPYPMLVLTGPQGSGKKELAMRLVQDFPDFFGYAISHTTRKPRSDEENGHDYYFVSTEEFEALYVKGKFIQTAFIQGQLYGLTLESIECIARDGLACVVHMEIEGVLSLKMTALEPRYVLTMPLDKLVLEANIREKDNGSTNNSVIEEALKRSDLYVEYNQGRPGFFDMFINTNDIVGAYYRLKRLVMDYLGLASEEGIAAGESESGAATEATQAELEGVITGFHEKKSGSHSRAWSKNSLPLSGSQKVKSMSPNKPSSSKNTSNSTPYNVGHGAVQEESLKRRRDTAKEVLNGVHNPSHQMSVTSRTPGSAPYSTQKFVLGRPGNTGPGKPKLGTRVSTSSSETRSEFSRMSWEDQNPNYTFQQGEEFRIGPKHSSTNSQPKARKADIGDPDLRPEY